MVTRCIAFIECQKDEGTTTVEAIKSCSRCYNIAKSNLWRWWKIYDEFGENHIHLNARMKQLRKRYVVARRQISEQHIYEFKRIVDDHPEYYLDEFVLQLARLTGIYYHPSTISRILTRDFGYSLQVLQEKAIQRNEVLRAAYKDALKNLLRTDCNPRMVVFIDETHKDKNSSRRRRGWGRRNKGLFVDRWFREEVRYTLIASCDIDGFISEACVNHYRNEGSTEGAAGNIGREAFESWVEHSLVPILGRYDMDEERSIVVMDNASTHMGHRTRDLVEGAGAYLLYTAPYSPDLNPIEMMFSLYKQYLKRHHNEFKIDHVRVHWDALSYSVTKDIAIKEFRKCGVPYSDSTMTSGEKKELVKCITEFTFLSML